MFPASPPPDPPAAHHVLTPFHTSNLHTLRVRYELDMIYTYSGNILIAVRGGGGGGLGLVTVGEFTQQLT